MNAPTDPNPCAKCGHGPSHHTARLANCSAVVGTGWCRCERYRLPLTGWVDTREKRRPTPAEVQILWHWILMASGSVLAADVTADGAIGVGDLPDSPGWWAIPADEWHEKWKVVR